MDIIKDVIIWDSDRTIAERGDICIEAGRIAKLMPPRSAEGNVLHDGRGHTVAIPSFVNAHTHISMTLLRGLAEELPLMEWLETKIWPIEDRMTASDIRTGAELALLEMFAGGTACFADMYFYMEDIAEAVLASGARAALGRAIMNDDGRRLREGIALADAYDGRDGRIIVQLAPHAPYTVSREMMTKTIEAARERDLGIHFHWLETQGELEAFRSEYRIDPNDYLRETGLLDARELILAHSVWHPLEELTALTKSNVTAVHCPNSNMKLGSGFAPIKEMMAAGVNIALGTDGASSNNRLQMWEEIRSASLIHKGVLHDPTAVSARSVLAMATVNGARGVGFKNSGLIKTGLDADITLIDTDRPHYVGMGLSEVPEFLVYSGSSADVVCTICSGRVLYKDGEFKTLDSEKIIAEARSIRKRLTDR